MFRAILVVAFALSMCCAGAAGAKPAAEIRVMTYNIRLDTPTDGEDAWPRRRSAVSALVRFHAPDILGMQEVRLHQRDQLASDLGDYVFLGVGRDDGREGGEFSSLAFRRDRFRLVEHGEFWLSPTPAAPSRGWDAAFPRLVTWGSLIDKATGRGVLALNTHWDHVGVEARLQSGRMIRDWIGSHRKRRQSVVFMGDFNAPAAEASFQALVRPGPGALTAAISLSATPPFGPAGTFNGFDILRADAAPIDHILVSEDVRVVRHGVLTQHDAGRLPSDHYPVMADIALPGRASR